MPLKLNKNFLEVIQPFSEAARGCSIQKAVLKNFAIFTKKQLWQSIFFNKVTDHQVCNFILKRDPNAVVYCEIFEIPRIPFPQNTSGGFFCPQNRSKETERYSRKRYSTNIFV